MNHSIIGTLFGVTLISTGCATKTWVEQLATAVEPMNCIPYAPPRSDHGPGWVFSFTRTADGRTVQRAVCEQLFDHLVLKDSDITIPNTTLSSDKKVGLNVSLLEGLVKNVSSANANLKVGSVDSLDVSWGPSKSYEMTDKTWWDGKQARAVSASCLNELRRMKNKGEFDNNVYVVDSAVQASTMKLTAKTESSNSIGAGATLSKLLEFKPEISVKETGTASLEIQEKRYVCYSAILLKEFRDTLQLGPVRQTISGEPADLKQIRENLK